MRLNECENGLAPAEQVEVFRLDASPFGGPLRYSYRGLSPHQFMPMPGVHQQFQRTVLRTAADASRYVS
ncbi:MAG: hypothetical protein EA420_00935 [Candidatus Competibacteraceae bacterium]|nr:MAG: hypothetical protein EA420_00935 [Candidatus Competibacteraceae bacterium]